jgi:hypothetical protein
MWQCSRQHENREEARFCGKCGERRVLRVHCTQCGAVVEPEDFFCTSCGHPRESAPESAAPPLTPPPEPAPAPPAPPAAAAAPPTPTKPEPITFSFGGAVIEMEPTAAAAPKEPGAIRRRPPAPENLSPVQSAILSFLVIAVLLGLALYFITR